MSIGLMLMRSVCKKWKINGNLKGKAGKYLVEVFPESGKSPCNIWLTMVLYYTKKYHAVPMLCAAATFCLLLSQTWESKRILDPFSASGQRRIAARATHGAAGKYDMDWKGNEKWKPH